MLIDGRNIEVVALDGSPLRRLVLDPAGTTSPRHDRGLPGLRCREKSVSDVSRHHIRAT